MGTRESEVMTIAFFHLLALARKLKSVTNTQSSRFISESEIRKNQDPWPPIEGDLEGHFSEIVFNTDLPHGSQCKIMRSLYFYAIHFYCFNAVIAHLRTCTYKPVESLR